MKASSLREHVTSERCYIAENYSDEFVSVAQARVEPGITTVAHHLDGINELYLFVCGQGQLDVGDLEPAKVCAGDLIVIPAGTSQRITNIGKNDLIFYCVCTPKFTAESYHDEEQETT